MTKNMTNSQILKKAIEKAVEGGFDFKKGANLIKKIDLIVAENILFAKPDIDIVKIFYGIIFSHDFAKAFWGENKCWERYLQKMVLEENPLKYIEKELQRSA